MKEWIEEWWPLILLGGIIVLVVGVAYGLSSDWAVEPLDGVATLGSMILSVFLIYIYQRQNRILERQQNIMESEEEISEASQVAPNIHVDWSLQQDGSLKMDITNTGADDAYHVTVHTELEVLDDGLDVETSEWSCEAFRRVATGTDQDFVWEDEVLYDVSIDGDRYLERFSDVTEVLVAARENDESDEDSEESVDGRQLDTFDTVEIRVSVWLSFEDIRGDEDEIELLDSGFEIAGRTELKASPTEGVDIDTLLPRIRAVDMDVFDNRGREYFGVEFESMGGSEPVDFSVRSEIRVFDGSEWVSSDEYGFSGGELEYRRDDWLLTGDFLFEWWGEGDEVVELSFEELSEKLLDQGFDGRISIRFRVQYVDAAGHSGPGKTGEVGVVDFGSRSEELSSEVPVVSEPCSLYEVL